MVKLTLFPNPVAALSKHFCTDTEPLLVPKLGPNPTCSFCADFFKDVLRSDPELKNGLKKNDYGTHHNYGTHRVGAFRTNPEMCVPGNGLLVVF